MGPGAGPASRGNPASPGSEAALAGIRRGAPSDRWNTIIVNATGIEEVEAAFAKFAKGGAEALLIVADPFFASHREHIIALAARYKLPAIYNSREWATLGGLVSYGPSIAAAYRRTGELVAKILGGTKPGDLPVEESSRFELVLNARTANGLGLSFQPAVLARADEVIE